MSPSWNALELVFPFTGHFRRTKLGDTDAPQQRDQRHTFGRRNQLASLAADVIL